MLKKISLLAICALIWYTGSSVSTNESEGKSFSISVTIYNIRNKTGRIQLHIYRDQQGYSERKGWKSVLLYKNNMVGNTLKYTFTGIPPGTYGLALLDDENKNTVMDFGWVLPKEGYGFGDYFHTGWSTPHFDDFKFYLNADKSVSMKVKYM